MLYNIIKKVSATILNPFAHDNEINNMEEAVNKCNHFFYKCLIKSNNNTSAPATMTNLTITYLNKSNSMYIKKVEFTYIAVKY